MSCKCLPIVSFPNPIIYYSLLDSQSPVRMLLRFRTMSMIFLNSLNSKVLGKKTWLHCQVYCSVEGCEAQKGYGCFNSFPPSFGPFLPNHESRVIQLLQLPSQREGSLYFILHICLKMLGFMDFMLCRSNHNKQVLNRITSFATPLESLLLPATSGFLSSTPS